MKTKSSILAISLLTVSLVNANTYDVKVTEKGFNPSNISATAGEDVTLKFTRTSDTTCATEVHLASVPNGKTLKLPLNKAVALKVGKVKQGEIRFTCGMDMVSGVITVK